MKTTTKLFIFIFTILPLATSAYAQPPREQLSQMVQQLQQTPTDYALREKIIKLAQDVKPTLAVPPEAKRAFVMGGTYQKEAKSLEDFGLAVKAFQDASTAAPWWGDAYYNLSVALESAKRYDEAKSALTLYLLTKPKDAEQAQERLYAIEAKKDLVARAAASAASAARAAEERKKNSIEGAWFATRDEIRVGYISPTPSFIVTRKGSGFEVVMTGIDALGNQLIATIVNANETTLRFSYVYYVGNPVTYDLHREGEFLVGQTSSAQAGNLGRERMVRKPWAGSL